MSRDSRIKIKSARRRNIDDTKGATLVSASSKDKDLQKEMAKSASKIDKSKLVGALLGKKASKAKISKVVFDRNGYPYHGRVKALAEAVREEGLDF